MDYKDYLLQVKKLDIKISSMVESLQQLRSLSTRVTCDTTRESIRSSKPLNGVALIVDNIIDLENEIAKTVQVFIDVNSNVTSKINLLENDDYKMVLIYRYIAYLDYDDIATKMSFSTSYVFKLHKKALIAFSSVYNNDLV